MSGPDYTLTPNLGLYKPVFRKDPGRWADHLNANADTLDLTISGLSNNIGGPFLPIAGGDMGGPLNYTATGGTVARSAQDRAADVANVLDFGADPTGVADSAPAINAAIASKPARDVYIPTGTYRINGQINVTLGTTLRGASVKTTFLAVDQAFSPTANGVLSLNGYEWQSPLVRDLSITFAQPTDTITTATAVSAVDATTVTVASIVGIAVNNYIAGPNVAIPALATITAIAGNVLTLSTPIVTPGVANGDALRFGPSRANMKTLANGGTSVRGGTGVMYPPAIYGPATQTNRFHLNNIYIGGAWDGISALGNVAPHLENIEMGALNIGWNADGALDSVHVRGWRSWLYGLSQTSQMGVFNIHHDGLTLGWQLGRVDGLNAANITFVDANFVTTANANLPGGQPVPWVITGLQMDNTADLVIAGGVIKISSMYRGGSRQPPASLNPIHITGGDTSIINFALFQNGSVPTIGLSGGRLLLEGGTIATANGVTSILNQTGGTFVMLGSYVNPASTFTVPMFNQTSGVIVMEGNTWHGGVSGVAVNVGTDSGANSIINNDFQQYTLALPVEPLAGLYSSGWDGVYGHQLVLGGIGQAGRLDFRRGTDGLLAAFVGHDGATNVDFRIRNLSGSSRIIFDTQSTFSFQTGGVQYATSGGTYGNQLKLGYTGQAGRVDFARGLDGAAAAYVGMSSAGAQTVGLVCTVGSPLIFIDAQNAAGTVSLRTNSIERVGVTDTAVTFTQPLVINASGPTIRSGTGAASGTQPKGSIWMRTDGAAGSTLYVSQGAGTWLPVAGV